MAPIEFLFDEPSDEPSLYTVVLAHGAGAPMDTPFMATLAAGLAHLGLRVARFEFPYMAQRRHGGSRRPPNRMPELEECWRRAVEQLGGATGSRGRKATRLIIGGKSMGGRVASHIADSLGVDGLVCLGYPFHPPRSPEKTRTAHLAELATPTLILQGTRDPFGKPEEVERYALSPSVQLHWLEDGDHSFKPRKRSGRSQEEHLATASKAIALFAATLG